MKKVLILAATILCIGCSQHAEQLAEEMLAERVLYTSEQEQCLDIVYNYCIDTWGNNIPEEIKANKVETIRWCEVTFDPYGDNLCEIPAYDHIQSIIWPNGYNVL